MPVDRCVPLVHITVSLDLLQLCIAGYDIEVLTPLQLISCRIPFKIGCIKSQCDQIRIRGRQWRHTFLIKMKAGNMFEWAASMTRIGNRHGPKDLC